MAIIDRSSINYTITPRMDAAIELYNILYTYANDNSMTLEHDVLSSNKSNKTSLFLERTNTSRNAISLSEILYVDTYTLTLLIKNDKPNDNKQWLNYLRIEEEIDELLSSFPNLNGKSHVLSYINMTNQQEPYERNFKTIKFEILVEVYV